MGKVIYPNISNNAQKYFSFYESALSRNKTGYIYVKAEIPEIEIRDNYAICTVKALGTDDMGNHSRTIKIINSFNKSTTEISADSFESYSMRKIEFPLAEKFNLKFRYTVKISTYQMWVDEEEARRNYYYYDQPVTVECTLNVDLSPYLSTKFHATTSSSILSEYTAYIYDGSLKKIKEAYITDASGNLKKVV